MRMGRGGGDDRERRLAGAHARDAARRVAAVLPCELAIAVDGRPRRFRPARYGERWAAVAELDDSCELTVMITADGIPPEAVALDRVTDIEPYLEEPRT